MIFLTNGGIDSHALPTIFIHRRRQHETTGQDEPRQGGLQAEDGQEVPAEVEGRAEIQHMINCVDQA